MFDQQVVQEEGLVCAQDGQVVQLPPFRLIHAAASIVLRASCRTLSECVRVVLFHAKPCTVTVSWLVMLISIGWLVVWVLGDSLKGLC